MLSSLQKPLTVAAMVGFLEAVGSLSLAFLVWNLVVDFKNGGGRAMLARLISIVTSLPGVDTLLSTYIKDEVVGFVNHMFKDDGMKRSTLVTIPEIGWLVLVFTIGGRTMLYSYL